MESEYGKPMSEEGTGKLPEELFVLLERKVKIKPEKESVLDWTPSCFQRQCLNQGAAHI
jgi:hypothetical protein